MEHAQWKVYRQCSDNMVTMCSGPLPSSYCDITIRSTLFSARHRAITMISSTVAAELSEPAGYRDVTETPPDLRRFATIGFLLLLGHLPLSILFLSRLWQRPHYQFFPVLLAGASYLVVARMRGLGAL